MLRNTAILTWAMLYLVISTGFTLNAHYCGGEIVDVEVFSKPDDCCSATGACHKDAKSCCDDETIVIQLEQWQISSTLPSYQIVWVEPTYRTFDAEIKSSQVSERFDISSEPPPLRPDPLWILYHRLTYYG